MSSQTSAGAQRLNHAILHNGIDKAIAALEHAGFPSTVVTTLEQAMRVTVNSDGINDHQGPPALQVALSQANQSNGTIAQVRQGGDPDYQEIIVSAFNKEGQCIADVVIGLDPEMELRVATTSDGFGDGDKNIVVFPLRPAEQGVEVDLHNCQQSRQRHQG